MSNSAYLRHLRSAEARCLAAILSELEQHPPAADGRFAPGYNALRELSGLAPRHLAGALRGLQEQGIIAVAGYTQGPLGRPRSAFRLRIEPHQLREFSEQYARTRG